MRRDAGFTFLELVIAVFLAAVVAGAAGVIYLLNTRSFREGREKAMLQQNVSWCLEEISRDARRAARAQVPGPDRLVLVDVDGAVLATWDVAMVNGALHLRRNGRVMAPEDCSTLTFSILNPDTSTVGVVLELRDQVLNRVRLTSRVTLRNRFAFPS